MSTARCLFFAVLSMLVSCQGSRTYKKDTADPDVVSLRFAWPEGLAVPVHHEESRTNGGTTVSTLNVDYRLVTERRGKELWVRSVDVKASGTGQGEAAAYILSTQPVSSTVVSPEGAFVREEGLDHLADQMVQASPKPFGPQPSPESFQKMKAAFISALELDARESWHMKVGVWAEQKLEVGKPYSAKTEGLAPILNVPVELEVRYQVAKRVPCTEGGEPRCVELSYSSEPSAAEMSRLLSIMMAQLGRQGPALENLSATTQATAIGDPATLLLHRFERVQQFSFQASVGDEGLQTFNQTELTRTVYNHPAPK